MNLNLSNLKTKLALVFLSITAILGCNALAAETTSAGDSATGSKQPIFAQVGETTITMSEFNSTYASTARGRFYHGKPPEAEVAALQREIGDKLVTEALLVIEAKRLKLKPNSEKVKQQVEQYDQRYSSDKGWQEVRDRALPILTKRYEEVDLRNQLEQQVRKIPAPNEKQLKKYYNDHPEKFTEPEQIRVSVNLLKVDPAVPTWDATRKKAEELVKQLRDGADFAELVKLHSGDTDTIKQGGDMGYLHGGMLSPMSHKHIDKLKPGEVSDPVGLMEGLAIFKLTDRKAAKLNDFETVKERASELYITESSDRAWKTLITQLKKNTPITVDESHYLPLPAAASKAPAM